MPQLIKQPNSTGEKVAIIFRKTTTGYTHPFCIFAVFPEQCEDYCGEYLAAYAQLGQHHNISYDYYHASKPAEPHEYETLLKEIKGVYWDYDIVIYQMITPKHRKAYKAQYMAFQGKG